MTPSLTLTLTLSLTRPSPQHRPFAPLHDEDEAEGVTARQLGPPRRNGWLAKTASAGGPLRHVGSSQLGAGEIETVIAPECRDRRYFTLVRVRGSLPLP